MTSPSAEPLAEAPRRPVIAAIVTLALSVLALCAAGCGDDFARQETADVAPADVGAADVSIDVADDDADVGATQDASVDGNADVGVDVGVDTATCATDDDCSAEAGACELGRCEAGHCVVVANPAAVPCDDGESCTVGDHCEAGACVPGPLSAEPEGCACVTSADCVDDGDPCNGLPYCKVIGETKACVTNPATVKACPGDPGPCKQRVCVGLPGEVSGSAAVATCVDQPKDDGSACDDGESCSSDDHCAGGVCTSAKSDCDCQSDGDCAALEDGNLCNGTLYCDHSSFPFKCRVNPASLPSCKADLVAGDCETIACVPATGLCEAVTLSDGAACDDGDPCTKDDACAAGSCAAGANQCPCASDADCEAFDDGDPCNGVHKSKLGGKNAGCAVVPATVVQCAAVDVGACKVFACDSKDGQCKALPSGEGSACDDGDLCTFGDHCAGGACAAGKNACGCQKDSDCQAFEDGDVCNGTLFCDTSAAPFACKVNPATIVSCTADGGPCAAPVCKAATGACAFVPLADGVTCDADGVACTADDACKDGVCVAGANVCACSSSSDCAAFEDGDACNGTLFCNKAKVPYACELNPATVVYCATVDDGACTSSVCDAKSGKCEPVALPDGATCNADNDACTANDACSGGSCVPGKAVCACATDADCKALNGGDACAGTYSCVADGGGAKSCVLDKGSAVLCDDDNTDDCVAPACVDGACKPATLADGAACSDGAICTSGDACSGGACVAGKNVCGCSKDADCAPFDDGDLCNGTLSCDTKTGLCVAKPGSQVTCSGPSPPCTVLQCIPSTGDCLPHPDASTDGDACDDGDGCTSASSCAGGGCSVHKALDCDDNKPCTDDGCDPKSGCVHLPSPPTACDDGAGCTIDDACAKGACVGKAKNCDDANGCTADSCDAKTGDCVHDGGISGLSCNDGDPCTLGDLCVGGSCKGGKALNCDDGDACTVDACTGSSCSHTPNKGDCDDGNTCTQGVCSTFGCVVSPSAEGQSCADGLTCTGGSCGKCTTFSVSVARADGFGVDGLAAVAVVSGVPIAFGETAEANGGNGWWLSVGATGAGTINAALGNGGVQWQAGRVTAAFNGALGVGTMLAGNTSYGMATLVVAPGAVAWQVTPAGVSKSASALYGVGVDGGTAAAIGSKEDDGDDEPWLVLFNSQGKVVDSASAGDGASNLTYVAIAPTENSDWIVAGELAGKLHNTGALARISKSFKFDWQAAPLASMTKQHSRFTAVAPLGQNLYVAAGGHEDILVAQDPKSHGYLVAVDGKDGKVQWSWTSSTIVGSLMLTGVASDATGVFASGAGTSVDNQVSVGWLLRVDTSGKAKWQRAFGLDDGGVLNGVAAISGGAVAVGTTFKGKTERGWLLKVDDDGNPFCIGKK